MMPRAPHRSADCPSDNILAACLEGRLAHEEESAVRRHAADCQACKALLISLSRPPDVQLPPGPEPPAEVTPSVCEPGSWVEHYEIVRLLGRGGMGRVYLARDTRLGRWVAIKFVSHHALARFDREARITAQFQHENIVVIHGLGNVNGESYLILEYLDGGSLAKLMARDRLTATRAVELIIPVVRALEHAHGAGIIHRDLKPNNVFVTQQGIVKVLDFGLARWIESTAREETIPCNVSAEPDLTPVGALVGSLPYTAPEQWGFGSVDHRIDIWAVGVMLYEMVAGRRPFAGRSAADFRAALAPDTPSPNLGDAHSDLPPELVAVVNRCLRKNKEDRYADAAALSRALAALRPRHRRMAHRAGGCPFPGLAPFRESDAERFFGRDQEVAALVRRVRDEPLTTVLGPSGVGKSSLVHAGVIPALRESGEGWRILSLRPGRRPLAALATAVASVTRADSREPLQEIERLLRREPGFLGTTLRRLAADSSPVLLVIDQLEELYALAADRSEREAFVACLSGAADPYAPVHAVVTLRSDFLDRVASSPQFAGLITEGLFLLRPPGRENLVESLSEPLRAVSYEIQPSSLVDELVDSLGNSASSLPILQFTAVRLWEHRDSAHRRITRQSFQRAGGVAGTLARHADEVVQVMTPAAQRAAQSIFVRLVTRDRTRAVVELEELANLGQQHEDTMEVIDHLVRGRLLVSTPGTAGRSPTVELIHESLIESWPTLRRWLDTSHQDGLFRAQLHAMAQQWTESGSPSGLLWRDEAAAEALRWSQRYAEPLTEAENRYLTAVGEQASRSARRRRRLRMAAIIVGAMVVVGSLIATVTIRSAQQKAAVQAVIAKMVKAALETAPWTQR